MTKREPTIPLPPAEVERLAGVAERAYEQLRWEEEAAESYGRDLAGLISSASALSGLATTLRARGK